MTDQAKSKRELLDELRAVRARLSRLEQAGARGSRAEANGFRAIVDAIRYGVWAVDDRGGSVFVNERMAELLGCSVDEIAGRSMSDFLHPQGPHRSQKVILPPTSSTAEQDVLFRRKDGSDLWTRVVVSPIRAPDGRPAGLLNLVHDIHRRKETETRLQETSDLFRQLGTAVEDVLWIMEWPEHRVAYVSPTYERFTGRSVAALLENPLDWLESVHEEDRQRVERAFREVPERGRYDEQYRTVMPDGTTRWIHDRGFPVRDAAGRVYRVAGMAANITERKRASTFRAGQRRVLEMIARGGDVDEILENLVLTVEAQSDGMIGSVLCYEPAENRLRHRAGPNLPDAYNEMVDGIEAGPTVGSCGTAVHRRARVIVENTASDPLWADYRELAAAHDLRAAWSQPIFATDDSVLGTFALYYRKPRKPSADDLDLIGTAAHLAGIALERERTEAEQHKGEQRLRQVIDLIPHMVFAKDRNGRFLLANRALAEAYGTTVDTLLKTSHEAVHEEEEEVSRMLADDLDVIESGRPKFIPEERFTDSRGNVRLLETTKIPYEQTGRREPAMLGVAIDITDRRQLERQLSDYSDNLDRLFLDPNVQFDRSLRELYDSATDFYVTLDAEGRLLEVNRPLLEALGYGRDQVIGRASGEFVVPDSQIEFSNGMKRLRRRGHLDGVSIRLGRLDGSEVEVRCRGQAVRGGGGEIDQFRVAMRDITRRKVMHQHLLRTEQLLTSGRLAAGVAHEINNPLQSLLMHHALLGEALPEGFSELQSWERIQEGLHRIQQVVNDLLDLHRVGRSRRELVDLNALVNEAVRLADSQIRARQIRRNMELEAELPAVIGVSQHLYQVILNLVLNGVDAMDRGGTLAVRTRSDVDWVYLEVEDNGPGIHPDNLRHVFAPLFSGRREGTGLGLFVTYNLVREHHGDIQVESQLGRGTRIRVQLPVASAGVADIPVGRESNVLD